MLRVFFYSIGKSLLHESIKVLIPVEQKKRSVKDAHDVQRKALCNRTSARKVAQVPQGLREFEADLSALFI